MMFGLLDTGFSRKRLEDIKSELEDDFRTALGQNVKLGPQDVYGQIVGIMSERTDLLWALAQQVYEARSLFGATGTLLDEILALSGVERPGATFSVVTLRLSGTPATLIASGSIARDDELNIEWITLADATIGGGGTIDVLASPAETGPIEGLSGTIDTIVTPVAGWASVTNPEDAALGREALTDAQARQLQTLTMRGGGGSAIDSMAAALLRQEGVSEVNIINNTSNVTIDGVPPKAVEAIVRGGDDQQIFDTIWATVAGGIETAGSEVGSVNDFKGNPQEVKFTRPTEVEIYMEVIYQIDTDPEGPAFPADGEDQMLDSILAEGELLTIGRDVIPLSLIQAIDVVGLKSLQILVATTPVPVSDLPISIAQRELAEYDSSRITFTVVP